MVMGVLSSALDLAKAAVAHDEQGALPEKVLPYYKKVRLSLWYFFVVRCVCSLAR